MPVLAGVKPWPISDHLPGEMPLLGDLFRQFIS